MGEVCKSLEEYLEAFDVTLRGAADRGGALPGGLRAGGGRAPRRTCATWRCATRRCCTSSKGLKLTTVVEAVLEGLRAAKRETRHQVRRHRLRHPPHQPADVGAAGRAVRSRTRTAAWSASTWPAPRSNFPAKDHKDAFQLILKNNVNCTAHAGEAYGPESIAQAIHYCGAHRIGHGMPPARGRRPAQLRQRPPHPARVLPLLERADRRGARPRVAPAASSTSTTGCG